MYRVLWAAGALLVLAGLFVYGNWKSLGFSCPCPGSAFVFAGSGLALIGFRLRRRQTPLH